MAGVTLDDALAAVVLQTELPGTPQTLLWDQRPSGSGSERPLRIRSVCCGDGLAVGC